MLQHVVCHADERIFLAEHLSVLANDSQAVDIRVNYEAHICLAVTHQFAYLLEVLRQWFGVVREVAVRRAVEADDILHTQRLQQCGDSQSADGVHAVDSHGEVSLTDRLCIHQTQVKHVLDMIGQIILVLDSTQAVNLGKGEVLLFGYGQHLFALGVRQELTSFIQELQGVPLHGVVAGGKDDSSCRPLADDCQLGGRRGSQTDIHHLIADAAQRSADQHINHLSADARVTTDNEFVVVRKSLTALRSVSCGETNDIHGI